MKDNHKFQLYSVLVSLVLYLLVGLVFVMSFNSTSGFFKRNEKKDIVEGFLLPRTNFPVATTFYVDPLLSNSDVDSIRDVRKSVSFLIFSTLFKESLDGTMSNDVVESYEFTNSTDLTLKLRSDVKWQDHERDINLTAYDVEFTLNTIKGLGQDTLYAGATNGNDIQIEVLDEFNMKIKLIGSDGPKPNSAFLHELIFPILPKYLLEDYPKPSLSFLSETEFGMNPIGSGVLKYGENKIDELILARNQNYYGSPVNFDNYIMRFYRDYDDMTKDYRLKNIDIVRRVSVGTKDEVYSEFLKLGLDYREKVIRNRRYVLYFNIASKLPDQSLFGKFALLRRALLNVIDRKRIVENLDIAREVLGPIDQSSTAFTPDVIHSDKVDVLAFDKSLGELGYKKVNGVYEKDSVQLKFTVTYLDVSIYKIVVEELQKQLQEVGVILIPKAITETDIIEESEIKNESFSSIINDRNFDALLIAVDHFQDPDVYDEWHSSRTNPPGLNLSGFSSRVADRTLEDGRLTSGEDRKTAYVRFQRSYFEETPAIYLINPGIQIFKNPRITGFSPSDVTDVVYFYSDINKWVIGSKIN